MGYAFVELPSLQVATRVDVLHHGGGSLQCLLMTDVEFRAFRAGDPAPYEWFTVQPPYREITAPPGDWVVVLEGDSDAEVMLPSAGVPVDSTVQVVLNPHVSEDLTPGGSLPALTRRDLLPSPVPLMPTSLVGPIGDESARPVVWLRPDRSVASADEARAWLERVQHPVKVSDVTLPGGLSDSDIRKMLAEMGISPQIADSAIRDSYDRPATAQQIANWSEYQQRLAIDASPIGSQMRAWLVTSGKTPAQADAIIDAAIRRFPLHSVSAPPGAPSASPSGHVFDSDLIEIAKAVNFILPLGDIYSNIKNWRDLGTGERINTPVMAIGLVPGLGGAAERVLGKVFEGGSWVVKLIRPAEELPASVLVPGGGLAVHEALGGHALAKHVEKTDAELLARYVNEPWIPASSTFTSRASAEKFVSEVMNKKQVEIDNWIRSGGPNNLGLVDYMTDDTGRSIVRGASEARSVKGVQVVLKKDANSPDGYFILTAYPIP